MSKVVVFGATGHVGSVFIERLIKKGQHDVRPVIHTAGNAWRLARRDMELVSADLCSIAEIRAAISGCTHVVNCALSPKLSAMQNLLNVCRDKGIKRFVHLSSVAVYGHSPSPESVSENAKPLATKKSWHYGWLKLQQDRMVAKAHKQGLPCAVLCIPNVSGIYSRYMLDILSAMREDRFGLVDGGDRPCCLVDVVNVAHALELAMSCDNPDGRRMFINDAEPTTWREVIDGLMPLNDGCDRPRSLTEVEARKHIDHADRSGITSVRGVVKGVLGNPHTRELIKKNALLSGAFRTARSASEKLPRKVRVRLSRKHVAKKSDTASYDGKLSLHQLRGVHHSCARAKDKLGYEPEVTFARSMEVFRAWYEATHCYGSEFWPLLRELYPHA